MLIDLSNKGLTGKEAEGAVIKAAITVNKTWYRFTNTVRLLLQSA